MILILIKSVLLNLIRSAGAQQATTVETATDNSLYALFVIPIVLILLLIIILCNCRPINKYSFKHCHTTCCTSIRPGEKSTKHQKTYDATILYSIFDKEWVESVLERRALKDMNYDINIISFSREFTRLDRLELDHIKKSKRIIMVVTKAFLVDVWSNKSLKNELKSLNANDRNSSFIVIYFNNLGKRVIDSTVEEIQEYSAETCCYSCNQRTRYNFSLKNVELVNGDSPKFVGDFRFLMPFTNFNDRSRFDHEHSISTLLSIPRLETRKVPNLTIIRGQRVYPGTESIVSPSIVTVKEKPKKRKIRDIEAVFRIDGTKMKKGDWNIKEYRIKRDNFHLKKHDTYFVPIHDENNITYVSLNDKNDELNPGPVLSSRLHIKEDDTNSVTSGKIRPVFKQHLYYL